MSINPSEYDLGELRDAADVELRGDGGGSGSSTFEPPLVNDAVAPPRAPAAETFRASVYETMSEREAAARAEALERPYLTAVPASYVGVMKVLEWLDFLLQQVGRDGAAAAIDYYEDIGWVSAAAADDLRTHLAGLDVVTLGEREPSLDDHLVSFEYVTKLASFADRQ
jgi:archaellum component FlaD/FlaE